MQLIVTLGCASFIFCLYVTLRGAFVKSSGGQSMRGSLAEAWTNIAIGFSLNFALNLFLLPLVGAELGTELTAFNNFMLGWIYTAASFVRQMLIRRYYNWRHYRKETGGGLK